MLTIYDQYTTWIRRKYRIQEIQIIAADITQLVNVAPRHYEVKREQSEVESQAAIPRHSPWKGLILQAEASDV